MNFAYISIAIIILVGILIGVKKSLMISLNSRRGKRNENGAILMQKLNEKQGKLWTKYRLHCNHCGYNKYIPYWLLKLHFIFSNQYILHCPRCHKQSTMQMQFNLIHNTMDNNEKNYNKNKLWESRIQ